MMNPTYSPIVCAYSHIVFVENISELGNRLRNINDIDNLLTILDEAIESYDNFYQGHTPLKNVLYTSYLKLRPAHYLWHEFANRFRIR